MRTNCLEEALRLGAIVREIEYKHGKKGGVQMFRRLADEAGICSFEVTDVGAGKTTTINMLTGLAWPGPTQAPSVTRPQYPTPSVWPY